METLMETLVNKDFELTEDSVDVAVYSKNLNSGEQENFTFVMEDGMILHERYNKNGVQTFSQKIDGKNRSQIALLISSVK